MYYLHNQPWATPANVEVGDEIQWNLWRVRQAPYNQVQCGDRVLLCCPSPEGSRITFEVELTQVVKAPYGSKREAWTILQAAFPKLRQELHWTFRNFRDAPYTVRRPDRGHLLTFTYEPVRELQTTRPVAWRLRPNGWLPLTDEQATQVIGSAPSQGQGRMTSPVLRKAIELHAMKRAHQWLVHDRGFAPDEVRDTSVGHPYDFEAGPPEAPVLRVEVKGLSGPYGPVLVTGGEVLSARDQTVPTIMVIVSGVQLRHGKAGPVGQGGEVRIIDPWVPTSRELKVEIYRYDPPK